MPLARIDVPHGFAAENRAAVGETVHAAMVAQLDVPERDHFQVITEHAAADLVVDPSYLGIERTRDAVIVQVTLNEGRTLEQKTSFYKAVADGLHQRVGLRREDVFITLVEVKRENWSFGNGEAQYA